MSNKGGRLDWEALLVICPNCDQTVSCFTAVPGKTTWVTCGHCKERFVARYGKDDDDSTTRVR